MPSAKSKLKDPVEIDSISKAGCWPNFITEPLPKFSSIWLIAASKALFFSLFSFS